MSKPLRIAVWYNLPHGGARRALFDQVKGLVGQGHHIEAWHPTNEGARTGFADIGELVEQHEVPLAETARLEVNHHVATRDMWRYASRRMTPMIEHSAACARQIEAGGFDLLFAHQDALHNVPFIGREVKGMPKVLYLQEPYRPLYEAHPYSAWAHDWPVLSRRHPWGWAKTIFRINAHYEAQRVQVRQETRNAQAFDRLLVNSYFSRESVLRAYGSERIDVRACYLGIDFDRFENLNLPRERFVIGLGEFGYRKNAEAAIRAVATIERNRPSLVWVGNRADEEYRLGMEALALNLGVELRVETLVSDEALKGLLSRAGAMVYAPRLEPFGYAPLEANACGLAVAAVAEGGVRETVVDGVNGILADPDPQALGQAIEAVLTNPAMGERAERHVREHWGLDKANDRLERQLREVAKIG